MDTGSPVGRRVCPRQGASIILGGSAVPSLTPGNRCGFLELFCIYSCATFRVSFFAVAFMVALSQLAFFYVYACYCSRSGLLSVEAAACLLRYNVCSTLYVVDEYTVHVFAVPHSAAQSPLTFLQCVMSVSLWT